MKKMKKKILLLIIGCALLHWPRANATTYVCRQGIDSLLNSARAVVVYPNPVVNALHVRSGKGIQELVLYAMDGRMVKKVTSTGKSNQLYLSDLQCGAYMLNAIFEDGTKTSKMIIKQ
ncbi:putative secreted protein (Por secretion system target) [Chitinophaga niastensis]|uniref:Putative secreted protein (Por secretion system target) n=1 Tax=Chitinophaga niastensis TaxID=536980 RepID=A0A2P8HMT6_CHINA|nr:T9SS type A sorting domain-containing protein [Chitinophaga niastensis]PSL47533.1 putative secreted protein (Por secretion system target) [Chitinophaga niastensis]